MVVELWVTFPKFDRNIYFPYSDEVSPFVPKFDHFRGFKKILMVPVAWAMYLLAKNMEKNVKKCNKMSKISQILHR
jgi:hypothetical protein